MEDDQTFSRMLTQHWENFVTACHTKVSNPKDIDGYHLDLATVVAVSRYGTQISLATKAVEAVNASAGLVKTSLERGLVVYGVNTGFGGSADTRSSAVEDVQDLLIRQLHYGIISVNSVSRSSTTIPGIKPGNPNATLLPIEDPAAATTMPESWARASMVIRLNSLANGASGVRVGTVQSLVDLLNHNIVPQIPLRGSISASGDLNPLSYIGGAMQGRPSIMVWTTNQTTAGSRQLVRAQEALAKAGLKPIDLGPKEGLAIVNGTAVSAAVASLALHEAHCQAALCQVLTAMSVEALHGTDESFDPFIASVRPHVGQIDSSKNILSFLTGSRLVHHNDGSQDMTLRQDRYSIRTASQWIGPVLEDLLLAHRQLSVELNSVTDNPLIKVDTGAILHGGNFQAKSISSAMEKTRAGLQTIGRMLFSQCTELINPTTNRGLPPNLVVDNPSTSFIWKGTDIMVAALTSELGFLANPVSVHVQTAEMGNQALNSLALISGRYTLAAADILTQLSAAHLLALCQAFDLRALQWRFRESFEPEFRRLASEAFAAVLMGNDIHLYESVLMETNNILWSQFTRKLDATTTMDPEPQIVAAVDSLQPLLLQRWPSSTRSIVVLKKFSEDCIRSSVEAFETTRRDYRKSPNATPLLGVAAKRLYLFVRNSLEIPFLGDAEINVTTPPVEAEGGTLMDKDWPTVGGFITRVYEAMKSGGLYDEVIKCFKDVQGDQDGITVPAKQ